MTPRTTIYSWDPGRVTALLMKPNWPRKRARPHVDQYPDETELGRTGLQVLRGLIAPTLCDDVVARYRKYEDELLSRDVALRDAAGRNHRVTNFHLICPEALDIGCHPAIHEELDRYFGRKSMVYTSLYFKHGSQQDTHIDTPFFVSNPIGWFAGVWVALEDVNPLAGPVEYFPRAHRLFDTREKLCALHDGCSSIEEFFARVCERASTVSQATSALLRKGDVLIWHHALPHGGQKAREDKLTRNSLVFHMGAEGVNISYEGLFGAARRELPRYGTFRHRQRAVARVSLPSVMI